MRGLSSNDGSKLASQPQHRDNVLIAKFRPAVRNQSSMISRTKSTSFLADIRLATDNSPTGYSIPKQTFDGWFIGGGVENSLDIVGISLPGWFMKTEYRVAEYNRKDTSLLLNGAPSGDYSTTFKPYVQTVSTSLVYRFNATSAPVSSK